MSANSGSKTPKTHENIDYMFTMLESPSKPLTKWELGFLESTKDRFDRIGHLSDRQFEILEAIYTEKTN